MKGEQGERGGGRREHILGESPCKLAMKGSPKRITFVHARAILLLGTVIKDNGRSSPFGIASSHILE